MDILQVPAVEGDGLSLTEAVQIARYKVLVLFYSLYCKDSVAKCHASAAEMRVLLVMNRRANFMMPILTISPTNAGDVLRR